ncbi:MAG: ATP-binding protein [Chloroflexota bacterium]|nr:ATP-binding protein [Chloroflexota bacterium]
MIERIVQDHIEEALDLEAAVVLVGPRQVGKTTLALTIGEQRNAVYLDLENPVDRIRLDDPNHFFEITEDRLVILDEVHRTPELFQILRGVIDRGRRKGKGKGRFLILGSASVDLLRQSGESLAGRVSYIDMTPVTAREVPNDRSSLERLWLRGGYPASYLAGTDRASIQIRTNLIRTYLERDVPMFGPRVPAEAMERLWTMLAHRQGSILNTSDLARSLDSNTRAVGSYVDLLCDLFLARRLSPYHANVGKRLVKSPKVYIRDSGILHALLGISTAIELSGNPILGLSWEGFVIENLISVLPWRSHAFFYRTQVGAEIDLLIEHGDGSLWAIEIKRSLAARVERGFHVARDDLKPARSFVVHSGDDRFPITQGVEAISVVELARNLAAMT